MTVDLGSSIRRRRKGGRAKAKAAKKAEAAPPSRPKSPSRRKPRKLRVRFLAAAALLAALGFGGGYLVATTVIFPPPAPPPELQAVPELRGERLDAALAALADSGLAAARADSVRHPRIEAGRVFGQSPLPGLTALPGAEVRLAVSLGPDLRPVPDLTRLSGDRAAELLRAGGFVVEVDTAESAIPAGRVVGIEPPPGAEVAVPAVVRVTVSTGPPTFAMPDLAGLGPGEARALIRALGLTLVEVDRRYSLLNVMMVFGQVPEPGVPVVEGDPVTVVVGREVRAPRGRR